MAIWVPDRHYNSGIVIIKVIMIISDYSKFCNILFTAHLLGIIKGLENDEIGARA